MEEKIKMPSDLWRKELKRSQANDVIVAIRNEGLDPAEFDWVRVPIEFYTHQIFLRLVHEPSDYYFEIQETTEDGRTDIEFSPGQKHPVEKRVIVGSWDIKLGCISGWLKLLKEELDTPDLWAAISQESQLVDAASEKDASNAPFNPEEQKKIAEQLEEIKEFLFTAQKLDEGHREFVTARLDYLKESSERMGRKDWLNNLVGVLFSIVIGAGLNSDAARELFRFAANTFSNVIGGLTHLLP